MGEGRHCFLREAKWEDMEQLFLWANDKEVRKNSFSMEPISYEEHQEWYVKKLDDAQGAEISYSIAPEYRGHGYGKELISLAEQEVRRWAEMSGKAVIKAQVKPENQASNKIFTKAGYEIYSIGYQKIL